MLNPYRSFSSYLKERYPFKVHKIAVDAGFTCPNRDGSLAHGGCSYCDNRSFSPNTRKNKLPLAEQIQNGIEFYKNRNGTGKFLVYFQAYTNTYSNINTLKTLYSEALDFPDVVGISIGTRPDCINEEILSMLDSFTDRVEVWIEYGVQTVHDNTLKLINRGHLTEASQSAIELTRKFPNLKICLHIILGLPGESHQMMMQTADKLTEWMPDGIKIHHLYITQHTQLEKLFNEAKLQALELTEYVSLVCDFLEKIPGNVIVQRLMGEISGKLLVAPLWKRNKNEIIQLICKEFARRGTRQGSKSVSYLGDKI